MPCEGRVSCLCHFWIPEFNQQSSEGGRETGGREERQCARPRVPWGVAPVPLCAAGQQDRSQGRCDHHQPPRTSSVLEAEEVGPSGRARLLPRGL